MSETNEDMPKAIILEPETVLATSEGNLHTGVCRGFNVDPEEMRDCIAEAGGVDPDDVSLGTEEAERKFGRTAVGFTRWNSSWVPEADKVDPSLN